MKYLRYLGLLAATAVMSCNTFGQTVKQKDRVISGNANLSRLDKEGTVAVKDDELRGVLRNSGVNFVIVQERDTKAAGRSEEGQYWIIYAKGRDTALKEKKISKEDFEWLIHFADRVHQD